MIPNPSKAGFLFEIETGMRGSQPDWIFEIIVRQRTLIKKVSRTYSVFIDDYSTCDIKCGHWVVIGDKSSLYGQDCSSIAD